MNRRPTEKRPRNARVAEGGFTLVELLIVVAIIAILAALLIPGFETGERGTKRTKCLSNLKIIDLGVYTYTMENRDRLPVMQSDNWACDMPVAVADALLTNGAARNNFYDPAFREMSNLWDVGTDATSPYHTIGYAMTFAGTASLIESDQSQTIPPSEKPAPIGPLSYNPSERVLAAGATISAPGENNLTDRTRNHYTGIPGRSSLKLRAAHLDSAGKLPTGDNVAMLDGSGRWRKFNDMIPRTTGASPVFWW